MKPKIFIDGSEGTTGLQINQRLEMRTDIELLSISEDLRKDVEERRRLMNQADLVFLCLPDDAAREAVRMVDNPRTKIIDASTAHRTDPAWVYGYPELSLEQRTAIANTKRLANPGCHATGFIAIVGPLIKLGLLPDDYPITVHSITGYSGGGKKMIAEYRDKNRDRRLDSPRQYGIGLNHKHIPEMMKLSKIKKKPIFCPILSDYYAGMATTVALHNDLLKGSPSAYNLHQALSVYYEKEYFVSVAPFMGVGTIDERGYIESNAQVGTNHLEIIVCGNEEQTLIVSRFDNLGKGASGAAIQNMNIMLGWDEKIGLLETII